MRDKMIAITRVLLLIGLLVSGISWAAAAANSASVAASEAAQAATAHIERACVAELCAIGDQSSLRNGSAGIERDQDEDDGDDEDDDCDEDGECLNQCTVGCSLWKDALDSSCNVACNTTDDHLQLHAASLDPADTDSDADGGIYQLACLRSCNSALAAYFSWLLEAIGTPAAPVLVADSLTATSLSLEWEIPERLAGFAGPGRPLIARSYLVQWRYEEMAGDWKLCRNQSIAGDNSTVRVDNLHPYTKYRFRVALILSKQHNKELFSEQSVIISTRAEGPPSSEPASVRATAVDHARISVSWEPGAFPNGKIVSYELRITEHTEVAGVKGYEAIQDLPADDSYHFIGGLRPNCSYTITVRMVNAVGRGPAGHTVVRTLPEPAPSSDGPARTVLILTGSHAIRRRGNRVGDPMQTVYETPATIVGVAIHVRLNLLFVADDSHAVWRMPLAGSSASKTAARQEIRRSAEGRSSGVPLKLSLDWLNDQLYVLVESERAAESQPSWNISRMNLNGSEEQVVLSGLRHKPAHFEVDPFNGYLFWSIADTNEDGLFRIDLADVSNGVAYEVVPFRMLATYRIGPFTVDHLNYQVLVPLLNGGRIVAIDFTPRSTMLDVRNASNTEGDLNLASLRSIAVANKLFYWADGRMLGNEEFHTTELKYYHINQQDAFYRTAFDIRINATGAQPVPLPVNVPTEVQVVLTTAGGKISWQRPHLVPVQGRGAWQSWTYMLEVQADNGTDSSGKSCVVRTNITGIWGTEYDIEGLRPDTEYHFRVSAYTAAGNGCWSTGFAARTLRESRTERQLIWSSNITGLMQTNVLGEQRRVLMPHTADTGAITSMTWLEDGLYFVSSGRVVVLNRTFPYASTTLRALRGVHVQSIAIDWIGQRLYWMNRDKQVIYRGTLEGAEPELLVTVSSEDVDMMIDALGGWLYYVSPVQVMACRLNGRDKHEFYVMQNFFDGKQVMGATLDLDARRVYWIGRSYGESSLFSAPMMTVAGAKGKIQLTEVPLSHNGFSGPLAYLSDRLVWLQSPQAAMVGNMSAGNVAQIRNDRLVGLQSVLAIDESQRPAPKLLVEVRPTAVDNSSIRVHGTWRSFNVSWTAVGNVNYGQVFYDVRMLNAKQTDTIQPMVHYENDTLPPYTSFEVSVQPYTYWAKGPLVRATLVTPAAQPDAPRRLRVFVQRQQLSPIREQSLSATLRWEAPLNTNGPLRGYALYVWRQHPDGSFEDILKDRQTSERKYSLSKLQPNVVYHVRVQAVAEAAGRSEMTEVITFNSSLAPSVPTVLVSGPNEIVRVDLDLNSSTKYVMATGTFAARHLCEILAESRIFWSNDNNEIVAFNGSVKLKLYSSSVTVDAMTVDWVNRMLYWTQVVDRQSGSGALLSIDLNQEKPQPQFVTHIAGMTRGLVVDPNLAVLFWLQDGVVYKHSLAGGLTQEFYRSDTQKSIVKLLLDTRMENDSRLILARSDGTLHSTPLNQSITSKIDTLPDLNGNSLTLDSERFYWLDQDETIRSSNPHLFMRMPHAAELLAAQPQRYPSLDCLIPFQPVEGYKLLLTQATSNSLVLQLPEPQRNSGCRQTIAGTVYTILYGPLGDNLSMSHPVRCNQNTCRSITTYNSRLEISSLLAFRSYKLQVSVSNFYARKSSASASATFGPIAIFNTSIGAPSVPRNLTVTVLSPTELRVQWLPVHFRNAHNVSYEILWQTQAGAIKNQQQVATSISQGQMTHNLTTLLSNQLYSVSVRATTGPGTYNQTTAVEVRTLPAPRPIKLLQASSYELRLQWPRYPNASRVVLQCSESLSSSRPQIVYDSAQPANESNDTFVVKNLQPLTKYRVSVLLYFSESSLPYKWPSGNRSEVEFVFATLGDSPLAPGVPVIVLVKNAVYKVKWEPARDNGSPLLEYRLEAWQKCRFPANSSQSNETALGSRVKRLAHDEDHELEVRAVASQEPHQAGLNYTRHVPVEPRQVDEDTALPADAMLEWCVVYNGSESNWILDDTVVRPTATFRVRARNAYGWSRYSQDSVPVAEHVNAGNRNYLVIAVGLPLTLTLFVVLTVCGIFVFQCRAAEKKPFPDHGGHHSSAGNHHGLHGSSAGGSASGQHGVGSLASTILRLPDVELATLRELHNGHHLLQHHNQLYTQGTLTDADIALLPQIRRERIVMGTILGSGQFGDVYEGKVRGEDGAGDQWVAIKTLKKGASEHDKEEFLKEAQLMSNFKHEHIMRLIGVCFHADELYIIMELMQGGDLLVFLRQSRPTAGKPSQLTLLDLISMCVDIATGCRYLEEMHFVHRDLACRNCLVSSLDPTERVVKIGDFGLARDIYKNDYYRTDGAGLLPVRWMSPESLVDGVYTSQSDIWAFGVLCWEIMTLGQQPYPARNNLEVLHFVKDGGRLTRPADCPEQLYQLMLRCWSYQPEDRPTFRWILEVLEDLKRRTADGSVLGGGAGAAMTASRVQNGGVFNRSYLLSDENHNLRKTGHLQITIDGHQLIEPPILLTPTSSKGSPSPVPKYLDMLGEPDRDEGVEMTCNGYEIPIRHHDAALDDSDLQREQDLDGLDELDELEVAQLRCDGRRQSADAISDDFSQTSSSLSAGSSGRGAGSRGPAAQGLQLQSGGRRSFGAAEAKGLTQSQRRWQLKQQRVGDKERTFSSSSTVSEHTVFPQNGGLPRMAAGARLQVALPMEECSSKETLLAQSPTIADGVQGVAEVAGGATGRRSQRRNQPQANSLKRAANAGVRMGLGCAEAKTIM